MDKFNTGLGYYGKLLSTAASPAVESFMNSSEMLENQENNKSKSDKGYHAVPPPFTGNFIPHKPDLTFMDEIVESENLDVTTVVTPSNVKTVESNHESVGHEADPVYNAWSPIKSLLLFVLCASANTEKEYNDTELLTVGIKREFSVVRTPQQNGAVKRRNRTLIEYQSIVLRLFSCFRNQTVGIAGIEDNIVASTPVSAAGPSFTNDDPSSPVNAAEASNAFEEHLFERFSPFKNAFTLPPVSNVTPMDDTGIFFSNDYC
ncbi:putative ribonuclease H-like domain-containing protein [Tanacetum coccineum]|uniref:Ribonuclease H-like domain-containing protein n=1 Tax=Tanacetum coccineum TaxID=301880 RepID=A0ABQ5HG22_9ASTR